MNLSDQDIIELNELLDKLVENSITLDQKKRLEEWLEKSDQARRFYVSYMDMSVSLGHYADETLGEIEKEDDEGALNNLFQFVQSWLPLAALVLFGFYLYYTLPNQGLNESGQPDQVTQSSPVTSPVPFESATTQNEIVAVLTKSIGLQRDGTSSRHLDVGAALKASELGFSKGMVQLEFMQGATAILEGPVSTRLVHDNAMELKLGKLRAHVPKVAVGFTVDLPMGKVIDLGTDFGIEVDDDGSAEVYVFRGKVSYLGMDIEGNEVHAEVSGGEAIFLDAFGVLTPLDMPLGTFAGSADLASRSLENAQKRRSAWTEMSQKLASDKKTLLYYNFDDHDSWSRVLQDMTKRNKGSGDGAVIGCKWAEGRWPGKGALQFSKNNDRVCLNISESLQKATLVAWVKLDSLNREGAPIVFSKPHFKGAFGWSVNPFGKLVLEIDTGNSFEKYESAVAFSQDRVGRWVHLATSFDGENKWINHFVNGRSFSREKLSLAETISLRKGLIGHYQAFPNHNPNFSMKGSIDEFALFDSVWDETDIRKLYEVGCPRDDFLSQDSRIFP
jgi:hypothetical protein